MTLVLTLLFFAIIVIMIIHGWRQGALAAFLGLLGWAVALGLIYFVALGMAEPIYHRFVEPLVVRAVEEKLTPDVIAALQSGENALSTLQNLLNGLGGLLAGQQIDLQQVLTITAAHDNYAAAITETVLEPILLTIVRSVLAMLIIAVVVGVFRRIGDRTSRKSGVVNRLFGAIIGALEGCAVGYVYLLVLRLLSSLGALPDLQITDILKWAS